MLGSPLVAGLALVALLARLLGAPLVPRLAFVALLSRRDRSDSRDCRQGQEGGENQGEQSAAPRDALRSRLGLGSVTPNPLLAVAGSNT